HLSHFRYPPNNQSLLGFGVNRMDMVRPSRTGGLSIDACGSAAAKRLSTSAPRALCAISRPRKRIEAFTLWPADRNLPAWVTLVLKSLVSILSERRVSLTSTTFWFFLASFSFFCCSKRYLP